MSPRAAWRLERLGHTVYDYTAGKADWIAAGLDTIRAGSRSTRVIDALERDLSTCSPDATVGDLRHGSQHVVVNEHRIVLGRIRSSDLIDVPADATAADIMRPGPATIRADADLEETRARLRARQVPAILVTTPEGELLGSISATD